jgi:2-C-methyl-D-erythritol 4-phosphate cytidylyltransferase/2-C-methyl-D-erythritol 2,4-cyclodiphosphate synthase
MKSKSTHINSQFAIRNSQSGESAIRNPQSKQSAIRNPKIVAVVPAGGTGTRMNASVPKQFLELSGKPILLHAVESLLRLENIVQVVIALPAGQINRARKLIRQREWTVPVKCVRGGATRQESVRLALNRSSPQADLVLVHDAVRPLCDRETMQRVVDAAWRVGGAIPALPATETIQRVSRGGRVLATPPREELHAVQTPQGFHASILRSALERARKAHFEGTDESSVARWAGHSVAVVPGSPGNIKITRPMDLKVAELLLAERMHQGAPERRAEGAPMMHIGHGMDYHRLVEGRKLILGGVEIPFEKGLEGHSDADALSHAICDALLGAAAMGDVGRHFPDYDPANRNRPSLEFLRAVRQRIEKAAWTIRNVDATILAQRPKLAPFMEAMRRNIAEALGIELERVSIKATTTEGMNAEGRVEGMSAHAVALLERQA